jgi:hypothetical protein
VIDSILRVGSCSTLVLVQGVRHHAGGPNWTRWMVSDIIASIVTDYTTHPDSAFIRVGVRKGTV